MLTFKLRWADLEGQPWRQTRVGWCAQGSSIEPYRNPALEDYAAAADDRLLIVVRERCESMESAGMPAQPGALIHVNRDRWAEMLDDACKWPLQAVTMVISNHRPEPPLTIVTGAWASGAVYAIARDTELFGHWDPTKLYAYLPNPRLDPLLTALFLTSFDAPYSSRTLFNGMRLLTDRSRSIWTEKDGVPTFVVEYPPTVYPPAPADLKPEADVVNTFLEILAASVERWCPSGIGNTGAELSGGLDSALVAATASRMGTASLRTYGVTLLGTMGFEQEARRRELIDLFGFSDTTLRLDAFLPLAPGSSRMSGAAVVPWEECYYEAMDRMMVTAGENNTRLVFTGEGGDELCRVHWAARDTAADSGSVGRHAQDPVPSFVRPYVLELLASRRTEIDRAPQSMIASSALGAIAHCSTVAMRRDIWTAHPLCTPELVRFCARLPRDWHRDRAVERRTLDKLGCSSNVSHPPAADDFSPACTRAMRYEARSLLRKLFRESRLADMGFVNQKGLIENYEAWCEKQDDTASLPFYIAAILELTARSLEHPPAGVGSVKGNTTFMT
jgi:asparagine synthase (glutamine-hydrolysing)